MRRLHITYKASSLSYLRFGSGLKSIFCFHGYGEEAGSFSFLEQHAGDEFTFYAIDLPFHGESSWNEGYDFSTAELIEVMKNILRENESSLIQPIGLMGFSLGGRIVLAVYEKIDIPVERLVLLAPDGLKVNFWYWLSTQSLVGNKMFSFTMKHPGWFFGFLKMLNRLKLVNVSIFKFVNYYIGDKEVRRLLYARWTTLRKLKPDLSKIKAKISNEKTKVRLVYGMHDRIILSSVGEKFRKGIEEYCTVNVIHSGHQVLHEKQASEILPALLN